jgi:hypothetical protein
MLFLDGVDSGARVMQIFDTLERLPSTTVAGHQTAAKTLTGEAVEQGDCTPHPFDLLRELVCHDSDAGDLYLARSLEEGL